MKKTIIALAACLLMVSYAQAQHEIKDNTFGGFGAGLLSPGGNLKTNFKGGFQVNAEINGRIYKPLWFYAAGEFENYPANSTAVSADIQGVSTLGGGLGLKIFPCRYFYVSGGAGVRGVISGTIPHSDHSTIYYNAGAGIYPVKFLAVFAGYTIWQAQTGYPSNNYFVAGVKLSFGRK